MAEREPIDPATVVGGGRGGAKPASDFIDAPPEVQAAFQTPARRFGKFILIDKLGSGGMGEVWRAWQRDLGRWVALKFLKGGDSDEVARFVHEARTAAKLSHPNIVATYEASDVDGRHYIAMDLLDGSDLARAALTPRQAAEAIRDAARAVHHANALGIIHRDLKPSNLFRTASGRVVVTDFGLARSSASPSGLSRSGDIVGTPQYMSPEQIAAGKSVGAAADVYGLGATLYALLTGRPPFVEGSLIAIMAAVVDSEPVPVRRLNGGVERELETIVQKAMEKTPARRYASAAAMADDLERYLKGEPVEARPVSLARRFFLRIKRHKAAAAATAVVATTFITLLAIWYFTPGTILLKATPKGAKVRAAGREWLVGDAAIPIRLRDGVYPIRIEADEHEPLDDKLIVERGKTEERAFKLVHFTGVIDAHADPGGAEIEFGGKRYGSRIPTLPVDTGVYALTAWARGHFEVNRIVAVERGKTASVYAWLDRGLLWDEISPEVSAGGGDVRAVPDVDGDGASDLMHSELTRFVIRSSATGKIVKASRSVTDPSGGLHTLDLGGDVGTAYFAALSGHTGIYAVTVRNGDMRELWTWKGAERGAPLTAIPVAVEDLNGDGVREAIFARRGPELVLIDGRRGEAIARRALPCEASQLRPTDAEGKRVLFVGAFGAKGPATVGCFTVKDGTWIWSHQKMEKGEGQITDLDHDGRDEIYWRGENTYTVIDGETGNVKWTGSFPKAKAPLIGEYTMDLDGDGVDELILTYPEGHIMAMALRGGRVLWEVDSGVLVATTQGLTRGPAGEAIIMMEREMAALDPKTGRRVWTFPDRCEGGVLTDWDGDGVKELVVGAQARGVVCLGPGGRIKWTMRHDARIRALMQFPDIDGDGLDEFVIHGQSARIGMARGPRILWAKRASSPLRAGAILVDVDGDGGLEGIQGGQMEAHSYLSCFDGATGALRWSRKEIAPHNRPAGVGDWDGDGRPDIAVLTKSSTDPAQMLIAYRGADGGTLSQTISGEFLNYATPVVRDVTGDGTADVIQPMFLKSIAAFDGKTGKRFWTYETKAGYYGGAAAADLDGDGTIEIVAAAMDGEVCALHAGDGGVLWESKIGGNSRCCPGLYELTDDGVPEVLLTSQGKVWVLDGKDGKTLWSATGGGLMVLGRPEAARSKRHGRVIVAPMSDAGLLAYAWDDKQTLWEGPAGEFFVSTAVPADLDGDGAMEVVAVTGDGVLIVLDMDTGRELWRLAIVDGGVEGDPAIADLDRDGVLDIVVSDMKGGLTVVSGRATMAARRKVPDDF